MYLKLILICLMLSFSVKANAHFGKIFLEVFESLSKKLSKPNKPTDEVYTQNQFIAVQASKLVARTLEQRQSMCETNSVECKIRRLVERDFKVCNSDDRKITQQFVNSSYHQNSPMKELELSSETLSISERYKNIICHIDDFTFIGNSQSVYENSEYAYAIINAEIDLSRLISVRYEAVLTFKTEKGIWKIWNKIDTSSEVKILVDNWWFYDRVKGKCISDSESEGKFIHPLLLLEERDLNCSTSGLKSGNLIITCDNEIFKSNGNFIYSTTLNACNKVSHFINENL